jgi:hypothetical protein
MNSKAIDGLRVKALGLFLGSLVGISSAVAETVSARWAESVGDHWIVTGAMTLVVSTFFVVATAFDRQGRRTMGLTLAIVLVMLMDAALGVVQNLVELVSMAAVEGPVGLVFLACTFVLAIASAVLGVRAWRAAAFPRWIAVTLIVAPICATVPVAPILVALRVPSEFLHVMLFAGPLAVAIGILGQVRSDERHRLAV